MNYTIGDKNYTQKALVLGQLGQLTGLLKTTTIFSTEPAAIILALGPSIPKLLAIVLIPEGVKVKDKDLGAIEDDMFECDPDTALAVVEDFFVCNPIASLLNRLAGMVQRMLPEKETPAQ